MLRKTLFTTIVSLIFTLNVSATETIQGLYAKEKFGFLVGKWITTPSTSEKPTTTLPKSVFKRAEETGTITATINYLDKAGAEKRYDFSLSYDETRKSYVLALKNTEINEQYLVESSGGPSTRFKRQLKAEEITKADRPMKEINIVTFANENEGFWISWKIPPRKEPFQRIKHLGSLYFFNESTLVD